MSGQVLLSGDTPEGAAAGMLPGERLEMPGSPAAVMAETYMTGAGPVDAYSLSVICRFAVGSAVPDRNIRPAGRQVVSCIGWLFARLLEDQVWRLAWRMAWQAFAWRYLLWLSLGALWDSFCAALRMHLAPSPVGPVTGVSAGNLRAHPTHAPPLARAARRREPVLP